MLTQVATVKQAIIDRGQPPPSGHDVEIQRLIDVVTNDLEGFCGRRFAQQVVSGELHNGSTWNRYLYPQLWPVTAMTTVTRRTTFDGAAETIVEGTGVDDYVQVKNGWGEVIALFRPSGWCAVPFGISLGYTGGYVLYPNANPTVPQALEDAAIQLVLERYLYRGRLSMQQQAFEGMSMTFTADLWPRDLKDRLLRRFVRHRII